MAQQTAEALKELADKETWTYAEYEQLLELLFDVADAPGKCRRLLADIKGDQADPKGALALKLGILRFALCQFHGALDLFADATDNKDRRYFQGLCYKHLGRYGEAAEEFERAKSRGWEDGRVDLELVEVQALGGDAAGAEKALSKLEKPMGQTADWVYRRGLIDELSGDGEAAVAAYEAARAAEPGHPGATFRLAYYLDLHGDEQQAIELYKECVSRPPVHANALVNLAVLYEDAGEYDLAMSALRKVLGTNPNHARARLFAKDVSASRTMYYDEDQARRLARRNAVLDIPVTDFELSVRARNCLKKMNIRTLGDLVKTTESELLSYKNFGETSLKEIKDMLAAKGLRLGQALEEGSEFRDLLTAPPIGNEGVLATSVAQLNLSVRSGNALESLKVATLGDLVGKTEAELLACRNFGQTSLNEVRQKLAEYGLKLREMT
jgi:DNA-directed RNA polymerase subunit alpha